MFHRGDWWRNFDAQPWRDSLPPFLGPLLSTVGVVLIVAAGLALLAGFGLLLRAPWARAVAIVIAVVALIHIPFGTIAGIYTLWVLLPAESEAEYRAIADPRF